MNDEAKLHDTLAASFNEVLSASAKSGAPLCIAYSGGMDSTVLLHLATQQSRHPVRAVYVDHGLVSESSDWATHCRQICNQLAVPFTDLKVEVDIKGGQGLEAAARTARYNALKNLLDEDEILLTAHHQQDQLETFLLQMLRGGGLQGLAAMPVLTNKNGFVHLRPLLNLAANALREYADKAGLSWIEDPSNEQREFDRNFLRHEVLPVLETRWPAAATSVTRSARLNAEAAELLDALAADDVHGNVEGQRLKLSMLTDLSAARRKNILRYLLRSWDLAIPSEAQLTQALSCLLDARVDGQPEAAWPGVRIRRYRDELWFFNQTDDPLVGAANSVATYSWESLGCLDMGPVRGTLQFTDALGAGISVSCLSEPLKVQFRQGGERLRPAARGRTRQLKNLLQESDIVPWMRGHIPLIYAGDQLLAVGDLWVDAGCAAGSSEPGRAVRWSGHLPIR
jgi:tRNA(Ile)-lysidine synthase